jgi:hypothetical protein
MFTSSVHEFDHDGNLPRQVLQRCPPLYETKRNLLVPTRWLPRSGVCVAAVHVVLDEADVSLEIQMGLASKTAFEQMTSTITLQKSIPFRWRTQRFAPRCNFSIAWCCSGRCRLGCSECAREEEEVDLIQDLMSNSSLHLLAGERYCDPGAAASIGKLDLTVQRFRTSSV